MCGICGFVGVYRPEVLRPMCGAMVHRGPDDFGEWHDTAGPVGLGHRRLAIIDLSEGGRQPMANEDGTIRLCFNGEIYGFEEHRRALEGRGHRFRGRSDCEVVLHLYEEFGAGLLERINGMFAFAIWDARSGSLLLARDHAGIKPLYYWSDGNALYFASELKALLQVPEVPNRLNEGRLAEYLTFLWVPGSDTLLEGVSKLEPGELLEWREGRTTRRRWFRLAYEPDPIPRPEEWADRVYETFTEAIRRQMVADVPLGAFLSGGADSSSIVACMRRAYPDRDIRAYCIAFRRGDVSRDGLAEDLPYAESVARHLGVNLRTLVLEPDVIDLLPRVVYQLDEPDADPAALTSYLICRAAREDGTTVLLSGTGGDEVFFGYRSHLAYRHYQRLHLLPRSAVAAGLWAAQSIAARSFGAQSALARRLRKFRRGLVADGLDRHLELVDWSDRGTRGKLWSETFREVAEKSGGSTGSSLARYSQAFQGRGAINHHTFLLINTFLAAHNFLYTDKTSMACSVEVRVPFMDLEVLRLAATIPEKLQLRNGISKAVLKSAFGRDLPREVLYRPKTGFGAPLRAWLANDLEPLVAEVLSEDQVRRRGLFSPSAVSQVILENRENRADHAYLIYALLTLELWLRSFVDRRGDCVTI